MQIIGIILSGGAGKRVGGVDKGLLSYRDQPLVQHVSDKLSAQVDQHIIAIHRNRKQYQSISPHVALDTSSEYQGPMAGITAAIKEYDPGLEQHGDYWVIAPCDVPDIPANYVSTLFEALERAKADCAVAHDGVRRQNLHCMFTGRAAESLLAFYATGGRAMHRWFATINAVDVDFSGHADQFRNINTLAELGSAD